MYPIRWDFSESEIGDSSVALNVTCFSYILVTIISTMTPPTTPTSKKGASKKSPSRKSPGRKKGFVPSSLKSTIAKKKAGKSEPTLFVWGMAVEFNIEFYAYVLNELNDGYTNPYKQYASGDKTVKILEDANFVSLKYQKRPDSHNEIMVDEKGYWRCIMIRKPKGGVSTAETRIEGLKILKEFFMSTETTAYPPKDIIMQDQTHPTQPHALGNFLQDNDVMEILKDTFDECHLFEDFFEMFTELAATIWSGPPYPECAVKLGFKNN